jgi:hypothetical protein
MYLDKKVIIEAIQSDKHLTYKMTKPSFDTHRKYETFFIHDKILDFTFSYRIDYGPFNISIEPGTTHTFHESSIRLRSSQILHLFLPDLEKYFFQHPTFRVKLALRDLNIKHSSIFLGKEESVTTKLSEMIWQGLRNEDFFEVFAAVSALMIGTGAIGWYYAITHWNGFASAMALVACLSIQAIPYTFFKQIFSVSKKALYEKKRILKIQKETML